MEAHQLFALPDNSLAERVAVWTLKKVSTVMPTRASIALCQRLRGSLSCYDVEDIAHVGGLTATLGVLGLTWIGVSTAAAVAILAYAAIRIIDMLAYDLRVVLVDRIEAGPYGHVLSVNRRVLLGVVRIVELIGVFALVYEALQALAGPDTFGLPVSSPVSAFYLSTNIAVSTGLATNIPTTDWSRAVACVEILLAMILIVLVLATVVASIGGLREIRPRLTRTASFRPWAALWCFSGVRVKPFLGADCYLVRGRAFALAFYDEIALRLPRAEYKSALEHGGVAYPLRGLMPGSWALFSYRRERKEERMTWGEELSRWLRIAYEHSSAAPAGRRARRRLTVRR